MNSKLSDENFSELNDQNEILTLIDLLVLRVDCITNESKKNNTDHPTVAEVDQNLIEYLYYLFTKFTHDDAFNDSPMSMIDKHSFVSVCQTLVRNGCLEAVSASPDQSFSEATLTSDSDQTITPETFLHEYQNVADEQDAWLVVDLKPPETPRILPTSTSDEQLVLTNDTDKSYESVSSPSIYLSPNASLIDIQNMAQEFDEINNHDGSTSNVMNESKTSIFNDDAQSLFLSNHDICIGLTNDENSIEENSEQMIIDDSERMSRREKKMQERWSISTKNDDKTNEQSSNKPLLGIEFPQISVLRRKFSSSSTTTNKKKINPEEEINTSPMTITVDNTNPDQINELLPKDLPVSTNIDVDKNNSDEQIPMKKQQDPLLSSVECQIGTITNINNDRESNPIDSNLLLSPIVSSSSPRLIPISSPSSLQLTANENDSFEPLLKEKEEEEEEKKKEEEQRCNDDYNLDEEKKNNSSFVHNYHASRILLINDEPTPTALLKQEKKEKKEERERASSPPLPTLEQFNQQRTEDESPLPTLSNELNPLAMTTTANTDNDERFKKVEIEEIPDDEEEETVLAQNIDSIEPTDYIHTDDVPTKKSTQSNTTTTISDDPIKFDKVFSCYEKALSKVVDGTHDESSASTQPLANDPIALRALKRFEERMNAAAAAAGTKTTRDEPNSLATKGKSSWSGSLSTPRKSVENLFKTSEAQQPPPPPSEDSSTITSEGYIRSRKTFDDNTLNYGTTTSSINDQNNNQIEEQLQPTAIVETDDKREVIENTSPPMEQTQEIVHENDNVIETSSSAEQSTITPYRFQLEGRRRLNTLERMRERRQSRESLDTPDEKQQQIQSAYTLKPEEVQDPIIRRALERFDEKNRTLTQTKSMNYDEIQDPITRRALMRLESNLKRTNPPPPPPPTTTLATNNSNENWYTENYTLGSLQPTNDRLSRYTDASQSPKTTYISVHQHYLTPSSNNDQSEITTNESDVQTVRAPTQPIYLTSTNQPLSLRQRSRSEDMLSSKDLTIGQTTNLDDIDTSAQLQRNRSSNEIAVNQAGTLMPNSLIKILEPSFVRTTESSVSYATPTQTYSAYSCEYTRPRRNQTIGSSDTSTTYQSESSPISSAKYSQPQNDIQRPTPYRPTQPTSAFAPIQSSVATATTPTPTNYYSQQPLPTTQSYSSMYSSNNLNQTPYTEDPIIRRALDRFNSQMQNSYPSTYQYQSTNNYLPRQGIQGSFHDPYLTSNRMTTSTTSTSSGSGYQSIIGRRRQTRHDEPNNYFVDNPSVGDAYSSSLFSNAQSQYPINNHYMNMNMNDEPPAIPPRFRRNEETIDHYRRHSTDEYLADNININNNNNNNSQTLPRNAYIHHAYPATITNATGFRPINMHYNQISADQEEYPDGAQLISSTNSSESLMQQRLNHLRNEQRLPSSASATMIVRKPNEQIMANKSSPDQSPPDQPASPGDSVFHRLAYTGTKASLSRSSSNSCSNLLNKNAPQNPPNQLQSCEIDFDDSPNTTIIDHTNEQISASSSNKYQRSKSVDTRARLKLAQARSNNEMEENLDQQQQQPRVVPSSKFTPINIRPPLTPRTKPSSNSLRTPNSNGIFYDTDNQQQQEFENNENISYNDDNYQSKLLDNRTRTALPAHRYSTNNIQPSLSTSAVNSNISRTKPLTTPINLDRRDSNGSSTDPNRTSRRLEDNRLVSPNGQRRNIPVSVFSPAKLDNKRPAPAPPAPAYSYESQQPTSYLSRLSTNEHELPSKPSSSGVKTPTGNLLNEYPLASDKHDNTKKMNVFERLFRGNKKKN